MIIYLICIHIYIFQINVKMENHLTYIRDLWNKVTKIIIKNQEIKTNKIKLYTYH